jgi:phosphoribosylanthranilate isomerase
MPLPAKICGLTRPEDAEEAVRLGASYLGVVFAGGPRQVSGDRARAVAQAAGQVPVIGVFGSQGPDEILQMVDRVGLAGAQLHGGASPEVIARLVGAGLLVLPVVRLSGDADLDRLHTYQMVDCPLLIEPRVAGQLGGAGVPLPMELAVRARERLSGRRMFLAGGLTPENLADMVRAVRPDAVDVSSGVEQIPGLKDHDRMARFLEVLRWL